MKFTTQLSLALLMLSALSATPLLAAPSVSGVSGTVATGQTLRVSGSGFGSKSPAAPYVWAPFDSSINPSGLGQQTSWTSVNRMTWTSNEGYGGGGAAKAADGSGNWTLGIDYNSWSRENQRSYIYKRTKMNFMVTDTSQNWKVWRAWATSAHPNIYVAANNGRAFVEYIGVESGFWGNFNTDSTAWVSEEIFLKASSAINVKDGQLMYRVNGTEKANGSVLTRSSTSPDYIVQNYPLHMVLANSGLWSPAWSTNNRVWADNIYVDTTWSRVMIGEAATYSACRTLDIQVPTAWADGSVSVVANTPSFSSGARAYVYVFDSGGNVNSSGLAVTIGQGSVASNAAPTVNAGADASVTLGSAFSFSGSVSDDGLPTPATLTRTWSLVSGPSGSTISNPSSLTSAVTFANTGAYVFRLTATDGALSATNDVGVTVNAVQPVNQTPTAAAGADSTVTLGSNVQLTGTGTDDGLPSSPGTLSYAWSYVSGPTGSQILTPSARTTAISFASAGTYVYRLTVNDGLLSATDSVQITVNAPAPVNTAPTANAGTNATVTLGSNAQLSGSGSDDGLPANPGALSYTWGFVSGPAGSQILAPTSRLSGVSFTTAGTYVFQLTVSDGLLSGTDTLQVTVQTPPNTAPSVSAGGDVTVTLGNNAPLNGTATDDGRPANALTTTWSRISGPTGVAITNASSLSTTVSFTAAGTYVFRLTASDGSLTVTDDTQVIVSAPAAGNLAPTVNAGVDLAATAGQSVAFAGRVSDDGLPTPPANTTLTWTMVSGPAAPTFSDPAGLSPDCVFPVAGRYVLRLTATDGALTTSDDVVATVQAVSPTNFAPSASAGTDQVVTLPAKANLSASATDDGLPSNQITYLWGKVSGPGTVSFGNVTAPATDAAFSTAGLYVLAMTVNDGQLSSSAQVSIDVRPEVAASAGPTVLGMSGRFQTGQQIQIVGANFGTKSPAAPLVYADFETGLDPSPLGQVRTWSNVENMVWSNEGANGSKGLKAVDGNGTWTLRVDRSDWTRDGQKIYVHRRERENFLVSDQSQAWKIWRMWPQSSSYPNIYAGENNGRVYVENIGVESGYWGSFRKKSTNWSTTEVLFQASSAIDKKDGLVVLCYDGVEQARGSVLTRSTAAPKIMEQNYVVHGVAASKAGWNPAWSTNNRMWVDDVYVDNTWARVILGDASTYASCRKFDIQVPTGWTAGTVSFMARTTAFAKGDRAYLYVFDKDGKANDNGYPVKVGAHHFGSLVDSGDLPSTRVEETPRNVFNPARGESASLPYALKERGAVKVLIYDRGGRRVKELSGEEVLEGTHTVSWDGRNDEGSLVASGIYIAVVKGSEGTKSRQKIAVIK